MYREKLETFESILKKVNVRLRISECAEGTVATPLGMCPLFSAAQHCRIPSWITQHQELEGIHGS